MTEPKPEPTSERILEAADALTRAIDARIDAKMVEILAAGLDRMTYKS